MTMRLPLKLALLLILFLLQACPSPPVDPAAVASAKVYFPPRFQHVAEPRFCFGPAERERAIQECEKMGANSLFEFVIDNEGHVKQARVVKTSLWRDRMAPMEEHARIMVFSAGPKSALYRDFYFPVNYTYNSTFEWQS
jgi:hypothetical protein